jgi:hypothetical protein
MAGSVRQSRGPGAVEPGFRGASGAASVLAGAATREASWTGGTPRLFKGACAAFGREGNQRRFLCCFRDRACQNGALMEAHARARQLIDAAHAADPSRTADGRIAELVYADRMEAWVMRLVPDAGPALRLAARAQHLERWTVPRASFPMDKPGYHAWRRSLYLKQAERARDLLLQAGVPAAEAADVATWVSKSGLKTNPGTQALEDAACLVFLENEIGAFAAQHAAYPREKFIDILRKTWRKMSPPAREFALGLELPPAIAELVRDAVQGPAQS